MKEEKCKSLKELKEQTIDNESSINATVSILLDDGIDAICIGILKNGTVTTRVLGDILDLAALNTILTGHIQNYVMTKRQAVDDLIKRGAAGEEEE